MARAPRGTAETALTPAQVVRNAFPVDKRNAKWTAPARTELTRHGYCVYTITKMPGQRSRTHKVLVNMEPGYAGSFGRCPEVTLDCTCARYLYVWNYALDEHGLAIRNRTNYEPPTITNPEEVPGCCKHAVVALRHLLRVNPRWRTPPAEEQAQRARTRSVPVKLTDLHDELARLRGKRP